ncbi:hypothetical protein IQ07DRAFT_605730 [Pyrenochaeta sp. DS3sAY3a]|nr:hypothetical protein IQ07DRAFT_605730 [Pyrenochaeta sp. DS3sAY3a]
MFDDQDADGRKEEEHAGEIDDTRVYLVCGDESGQHQDGQAGDNGEQRRRARVKWEVVRGAEYKCTGRTTITPEEHREGRHPGGASAKGLLVSWDEGRQERYRDGRFVQERPRPRIPRRCSDCGRLGGAAYCRGLQADQQEGEAAVPLPAPARYRPQGSALIGRGRANARRWQWLQESPQRLWPKRNERKAVCRRPSREGVTGVVNRVAPAAAAPAPACIGRPWQLLLFQEEGMPRRRQQTSARLASATCKWKASAALAAAFVLFRSESHVSSRRPGSPATARVWAQAWAGWRRPVGSRPSCGRPWPVKACVKRPCARGNEASGNEIPVP